VRIVRAAQFHEFVAQLLQWGTQGDVAYIPEMRTQIVSARTVAEVVAEVATSEGDVAQIVEIAGPREEDLGQLAAMLVARRTPHAARRTPRDAGQGPGRTQPADPDADMQATGGLLPGPGARLAGPTFQEWLDQQSSLWRNWPRPSSWPPAPGNRCASVSSGASRSESTFVGTATRQCGSAKDFRCETDSAPPTGSPGPSSLY
jgi:hypothetical protein